jgi:hypothetical protein
MGVDNEDPILIGCEESQVVCKAFRDAGYEAYSCDLEATRGNPEWHYQDDIMNVIPKRRWSLIILHPDCTSMALSGNRWYGKGMVYNYKRKKAIEWTVKLWELAKKHSPKVGLENPASVIFPVLKKLGAKIFYLQPWQHGHGETKKTGFALHGLEPLEPTDEVEGREQRIWKMAPSPTRKRDRSETYSGVASAMVGWANQKPKDNFEWE